MMKKLYKVTCCGGYCFDIKKFDNIYVIAEDEKEASDKALNMMKKKKYDRVDEFVSEIFLIADENESNNCLLII